MARQYWFWRDTARTPQFAGVDMWAAAPFVLFLLHMRLWTFLLALAGMVVFGVLGKFGLTLPVFFRMIARRIAGNVITARPWWYWERFLRK